MSNNTIHGVIFNSAKHFVNILERYRSITVDAKIFYQKHVSPYLAKYSLLLFSKISIKIKSTADFFLALKALDKYLESFNIANLLLKKDYPYYSAEIGHT
jgi:hypothetical protein